MLTRTRQTLHNKKRGETNDVEVKLFKRSLTTKTGFGRTANDVEAMLFKRSWHRRQAFGRTAVMQNPMSSANISLINEHSDHYISSRVRF